MTGFLGMLSAKLLASLKRYTNVYFIRKIVRNKKTIKTGGKLMGSGKINGIILGHWSDH